MQLNETQKRIIQRVVNVFETSSPDGDYANISIYKDGPHDIRQITYGRSQTTEYGSLRQLVEQYALAGGLFSQQLRPYAGKVGSTPLTDDANFKNLLKRAGREDPLMKKTQDSFFDRVYFRPAIKWAVARGFMLPLSALVIYDSFVHSGSIIWAIREMFPESPPYAGGDEKAWTQAYVNARHIWLASHPKPPVRSSVYRTQCFKNEIQRRNWDLSQLPINANGVNVSA
ncbi:hypothetical protein BH20ACI3_BH20ACI3_00910 [soil metagenome]